MFMKKLARFITPFLLLTLVCTSCGRETQKVDLPVTPTAAYQDKLDIITPSTYGNINQLKPEAGSYVSIIGRNSGDSFWDEIQSGAQQAIDDLNDLLGYSGKDKITLRYIAPKERDNVNEQINILDEELANSPLAIGIAAVDASACVTQFDYAKEFGIPIVMLDSGSDYQDVAATCSTNNRDAGKTAAEQLANAIGQSGEVLLFVQDCISMSACDREAGFLQELEKSYPDISVVETYHYNQLPEMAKTIAKEKDLKPEEITDTDVVTWLLEKHPNVKGVFATNLDTTQHVVQTLEDLGRTDLKVIGFDGGKEQMELLETGKVEGLIVQNPFGMGYATVVAIIRAAYGLGNESKVDTGYIWVSSENMNNEDVVGLLY